MNAIAVKEFSPLPRLSAAAAARSGKVSVAIEMLLQWAYAQELVHGALGDGVPVILGGSGAPRLSTTGDELATRISESRNYGFVAPVDAYAVHDAAQDLAPLRLRLPRECLPAFDCGGGFYRDRTLKRAIEVGGKPKDVKPEFVVALSSLVMVSALQCSRPDWIEKPSLTCQRGVPHYATAAKKHAVSYAVRFVGDMPWEVERARLTYRAWVGALATLQDVLRGRLERFSLTCGLPEPMPWSV